MIHVTKETAVLLKEKGFDLPCEWVYAYKTKALKGYELTKGVLTNHNWKGDMLISAPDIYTACIWLRAKGVHVAVQPDGYGRGNELVWFAIVWVTYEHLNPQPNIVRENPIVSDKYKSFPTHDEALEAGIVHALKYLP